MIPYYWQYLPLLMQLVVAFGLAGMMVFTSQFIGRHRNSKTKLAAYECGIEAVGDARRRFSVRFYMVTMLFLLFDVETVFLYPWAVQYQALGLYGLVEMLVFLGILIVGFIAAIYLLRNAVSLGLKDLDATLIKSPVVGPIYENWFRKETYYRQDTRLMYRDTVNDVVKAKVEEATGAKGIKLIKFNDYSPILGELYKPTMVQPSQTLPAA